MRSDAKTILRDPLRVTAALAVSAGLLGCDAGEGASANADITRNELMLASEDLAEIRADFNAAAGDLRLVFLIGPSCGPCLLGLNEINRVLGDEIRANDRLHAYVIYVPTLSAQRHHAERAMRLLPGEGVRHYWDETGNSGVEFQEALSLQVYAWDMYMIFEPASLWDGDAPPAPALMRHQLQGLPRETRFDADDFAEEVRRRLEELT